MRRFVLLSMAVLCSLFHSISVHSQQSDWEREQMRISKIKKVTAVSYLYVAGARSSVSTKFVSEFDRQGNLVKTAGYGSTGTSPLLEYRYRYDDKNKVIESAWDSQKSTATYKYNNRGFAIEGSVFNTNGTLTKRAGLKNLNRTISGVSA